MQQVMNVDTSLISKKVMVWVYSASLKRVTILRVA